MTVSIYGTQGQTEAFALVHRMLTACGVYAGSSHVINISKKSAFELDLTTPPPVHLDFIVLSAYNNLRNENWSAKWAIDFAAIAATTSAVGQQQRPTSVIYSVSNHVGARNVYSTFEKDNANRFENMLPNANVVLFGSKDQEDIYRSVRCFEITDSFRRNEKKTLASQVIIFTERTTLTKLSGIVKTGINVFMNPVAPQQSLSEIELCHQAKLCLLKANTSNNTNQLVDMSYDSDLDQSSVESGSDEDSVNGVDAKNGDDAQGKAQYAKKVESKRAAYVAAVTLAQYFQVSVGP